MHKVIQDVEITERVKLKVGTFEADLTAASIGKVMIDGNPIVCRKFIVTCEAGKVAKIEVEVIPLESKHKTQAIADEFVTVG